MRTQFLVLLLAILFITVSAFTVESECPNKVTEARKKFSALNRPGKAKFVKALYTKLTDTYPNVEKKEVGKFITAFVFKRVPAEKVCQLFKKIFKPEQQVATTFRSVANVDKKNQLRCVFECLQDKLPAQEIMRIVGKCLGAEDPLPCFAQELGEVLFTCVSGCFTKKTATEAVEDKPTCPEKVKKVRTYFGKLESKKEKKEFAKKVHAKLSEKYPNANKKAVAGFVVALLFKAVPVKRVCQLYKRVFLGEKEEVNIFKQMQKKANVEPQQLRCTLECLQDKLPPQEIMRIVGKCLGAEDPLPCFAQELGEVLFACVSGCFVEKVVEDKPTCPEKVKKVRTHFSGLERAAKKEFVKKVYKKLTEKYPTVEKKKVGAFIAALLFGRTPAKLVCKMYSKIFKSETEEQKNDVLRCVFECLQNKLPAQEIMRIVGKCLGAEDPLPCFAQELGEVLFTCVSGCFGKK